MIRRDSRSLGRRIGSQYARHFARSALLALIGLTVVFWGFAIVHSGAVCGRALSDAAMIGLPPGCYEVGESGIGPYSGSAVRDGLLPQRTDGRLFLIRGNADYTVLRDLRSYALLYSLLLVTLLACEGVRLILLRRQSDRISGKALKPISDITAQARNLSASNLSERIRSDDATGEMDDLIRVLNGMLNRIEGAYNNQKQFASDASHELRTPIAVIQGYADMLSRWGKSDPEVCDEAAAAIGEETRSMQALVEQLLFIARHENDSYRYKMEFFDLSELVEQTAEQTRLIIGDREIRVDRNDSAIVCADRDAIKQALRVFLDNAVKYTQPGGHIALSCAREEGYARVTVSDDGAGISEEDLPHVFDRFYRSAQARGSGVSGHGLGLSIARMIVRAHGGRIEVSSRLGAGSRFQMLLRL
ncbi:MAG: HAMP domain-containing protein [Clostridia bacterium]|nr:HAMP domain-containing protein [Clostridia bacterium]